MNKAKILIVEDNIVAATVIIRNISNQLENIFEYIHVTSLAAALSAIEENSFELILLDLMLPDSEGLNTIQVMTERANFIPIIVMTTLSDEKLIQSAFNLGVENYFVKEQYDSKILINVCRQVIRQFFEKIANNLNDDIKKLFDHLQSLDAVLEKWQQTSRQTTVT